MKGEKNLLKRYRIMIPFLLVAMSLVSCAPAAEPGVSPDETDSSFVAEDGQAPLRNTVEPANAVLGCAEGGPGVFTPDDVRCYLASFDPEFVADFGADTAVLFTTPDAITDWVGGAIIYHIPSVSSLVLDSHGDVDPQLSHINSRAALAAYSQFAANTQRMAFLKETVQSYWQTSDSGEPDVRLGLAWQEGVNSVFLISIAGLPADDGRFYCADEAWTIGEEEIHILSECVAREEGSLSRQLIFAVQEVRGSQPQQVQLALSGVDSNAVQVAEGEVGMETAVYQAAIHYTTRRAVVLYGETSLPTNANSVLNDEIDPNLLQNFLASNQSSSSLEFLFHNHQTIFIQPGWVVARDYLPAGGSTPDCARLHREYPGLAGGVIRLSQIGLNGDGSQALVFLEQACGDVAVASSYLLLALQDGGWVVVDEVGQVEIEAASPLIPGLVYNGRSQGCGDLFVYQANDDSALSEFITLSLDARAFGLSSEPVTLEIADYFPGPLVKIDLFGSHLANFGEFPYCNDVGPEAMPQSVWLAESGTITISIDGIVPEESCAGEGYAATILLEDILFRSEQESRILEELLFKDVAVGWCPG